MFYAFDDKYFYKIIKSLNITQESKKVLWEFLSTGGTPVSTTVHAIIKYHVAGVWLDDPYDHDDEQPLKLELSNFSNAPNVFPFYWESENLELFDDDLMFELTQHTVNHVIENEMIWSLTILISVLFGMVMEGYRHYQIGMKNLHINIRLVNNVLLMTTPTEAN